MALRDQPYIPLYVQDIMTDEKLNECCAATHGIYIKGIMCLMHKSETYGEILLKQKDKQTDQQIKNFAIKISKHTPYEVPEIEAAITELVREKVCFIKDDILYQPRMVKDNATSESRKKAGKKGAFAKAKQPAKENNLPQQKPQQITENANEDDNGIEIKGELELGGAGGRGKVFSIITKETIEAWRQSVLADGQFVDLLCMAAPITLNKFPEAEQEFFKSKLLTGEWKEWENEAKMRRNFLSWMPIYGERKRNKNGKQNQNGRLRPTGTEPAPRDKEFGVL